ncbi:DUF3800 domain-containing protein [Mucilaginibacter robiniae]|uniref:DUF3800 domain-containing protein n=1 Tax=Mucilaginibacter robiniae TaxID=2728022 RepID=A0A7L5E0P9_9SPHI|nr:DUF3800 domain-containing protein [Mucilaginibacter robiniae]QJD95859.1 DUF3800 domain-containing protein [Mucilaginibacter robiniae]
MAKEYFLYCDESVENGQYYSDFYGGALVESTFYDQIVRNLEDKKIELNLLKEVKWNKVTDNYLEKYKALIDMYFEFIKDGKLKIRIMFRQSAYEAINLTEQQKDNGFFLLYYQFIKHAFGFMNIPEAESKEMKHLRIFFDELPDNKLRCEEFKSKIYGIQSLNQFIRAKILIRREDIVDVDSSKHVILQGMDIILGSMAFRLNNMHKIKPAGSRTRGKRTIAKEKLYKHILAHIRDLIHNFNIGVSTGGIYESRWTDAYRHWNFVPKSHRIDETKFK